MPQLLIATTNPGKFKEISDFFVGSGIETLSLDKFSDAGDVPEVGKTFLENATIKAIGYFKRCGVPVVADDGGLEIEALGGEPGVTSRRWRDGKTEMTDQEIVDYTLEKLKNVPPGKRTARLVVEMVFYNGKQFISGQGFVLGSIATELTREIQAGYPFRSLFIVKHFNKFYQDLTDQEHELINHRRDVLRRISGFIKCELSLPNASGESGGR